MVTYLELKKIICLRLFHYRQEITEDNDLTFRLSGYMGNGPLVIIKNDELKECYDSICLSNSENLELYNGNEYEKAIDIKDRIIVNRLADNRMTINSNDTANGITYAIELCSFKYCIFIILSMLENEKNFLKSKFRYPVQMTSRVSVYNEEEMNVDWKEILVNRFQQISIKIKTIQNEDLHFFQNRKNAFIFEYIYNNRISITEPNELDDFFPIRRVRNFPNEENEIIPKREYNKDVVDYYKLAFSSSDPYIQYISFYHVIEYFYDEVFKKKMVNDLMDKLTQPDFSYKNEDQVFGLVNFIKNRVKMNINEGQGNELESLMYVLNEYIVIDDLKDKMDSQEINYYGNNSVPFSKGTVISWNDANGVYKTLAKRIYYTRNALIHSKSGRDKERYKPYEDEKELQKEIPLICAIAEMIIINSSNILK